MYIGFIDFSLFPLYAGRQLETVRKGPFAGLAAFRFGDAFRVMGAVGDCV